MTDKQQGKREPILAEGFLEGLREQASTEATLRAREWLMAERRRAELSAWPIQDGAAWALAVAGSQQAMVAGDRARALEQARLAATLRAGHPAVVNQLARCLFNAGQPGEALQWVRTVSGGPDAWPESLHVLGHLQRAAGDAMAAMQAFESALAAAPGFTQAKRDLATAYMAVGRFVEAIALLRELRAIAADDFEVLFNLGISCQMTLDLPGAEEALGAAHRAAPSDPRPLRHLAEIADERQDRVQALALMQKAVALAGLHPDLVADLVPMLERSNRLGEAERVLGEALSRHPADASLLLQSAALARRRKAIDEAARLIEAIDPRALPPSRHVPYWFERGAVLDLAGRADAAFQAWSRGHELAARGLRARHFDATLFPRQLDAIEAWLDDGCPASLPPPGDDGADLCFLVGFPRSGTTLLEMSLDAHPGLQAIEEQSTFERVCVEIDRGDGGFPWSLARAGATDWERLRRRYREALAAAGQVQTGKLILDKMPIRTVFAPVIARVFPKARFLFALRHPCDVVLSNYMQFFAPNEVFVHFHDLRSIAGIYDRTIRIWRRTVERLAPVHHVVRYESMVEDKQREIDDALAFLGLSADGALRSHEDVARSRARLGTNSYHQVVQPIYGSALARWERYRGALEPVLPVLAPHVVRWGYPPL